MIKLIMGVIVILLAASFCFAGPFDAQDEEAQVVASMVRGLLGGDTYEKTILESYPDAKIHWSGRTIQGDANTATYVVYCEVTPYKLDAVYYYFELIFNDINSNPELREKYGV